MINWLFSFIIFLPAEPAERSIIMYEVFLGTVTEKGRKKISEKIFRTESESKARKLAQEITDLLYIGGSTYEGSPVLAFYKEVEA